jgi:SPW repeat
MQLHHLRREPSGAQAVPGNGAPSQAVPVPGPVRAGFAAPGMAVQACVMAGMLAGLWVAISPWFLSLQGYGGNATATDLIVGLAVVALAVFGVTGRGLPSQQAATALAGVWLIISPFILDAKFPITAAMYWSNVWAGGVIAVLAFCALALIRTGATR